MAQLLISLGYLGFPAELSGTGGIKCKHTHTHTCFLSISSVAHDSPAKQPVPLLREVGPVVASSELSDSEKVPGSLPQSQLSCRSVPLDEERRCQL